MKKLCFVGMIFLFGLSFLSFAQDQDNQVLREEVSVTNIEVPVRVFHKGKPVDNLSKADFKLYENEKLQAINGFFLKKKKIDIQRYELKAKERKEIFPSRYFVLVFNLIDYNSKLDKGLDYVFDKILKNTDQLLLMVNKKISFYDDLSDKEEIRNQIKNLLREKGRISSRRLSNLIKHIERKVLDLKTQDDSKKDIITPFLREYYFTWQTFKKQYLMPTVEEFYYFANHLESIKKEKWVINFYQVARYPQIRDTSPLAEVLKPRMDTREFHKMNFDLKAEMEFPASEVSKLFYKVNATFHSILIPTERNTISEDLELIDISTALENCYREITKKTGGSLIASANLESALDTISEKEDVYYMLTYEPENSKKTGKIRVELTGKNSGYKVVYDKNMRASYIKDFLAKKEAGNPDIKIKEMAFKDKKLQLLINGFLLKKEKKKREASGQVVVHVRVEDKAGKTLFDKNKKLNPANTTTSIEIDFTWMTNGKYYILTDVLDEFTGNTDLEFVQAVVSEKKTALSRVEFKEEDEAEGEKIDAPAGGDGKLAVYLRGAAAYCERLKQAAFHFYCSEKVESILDLSYLDFRPEAESRIWRDIRNREMGKSDRMKSGKREVRVYVFDYQIVSNKGKVKEQRKLISKKVAAEEEKDLQGKITSFLTERAVFGPVTLLSKEKQGEFNFKLLKYEKHKKRRYAVIEAAPKNKNINFSYGKIWIDSEDYSIKKIKVDPRSISGYKKLLPLAKKLQARLFLTCEVEYNKIQNGLRFPTKVQIFETYRGGPIILKTKGYKGWERSKTIFSYDNYKFFNVDMSVTNN
jgi:hypothetical protein